MQISIKEDPQFVMGPPVESILKNEEKRYLLLVERGDFNGVRRLVQTHSISFPMANSGFKLKWSRAAEATQSDFDPMFSQSHARPICRPILTRS